MGMKVVLQTIGNLLLGSGLSRVNSNFSKVADEFDKVLYRDGSLPLTGPVDANSQRIYNLPNGLVGDHSPMTFDQFLSYVDVLNGGGTIVLPGLPSEPVVSDFVLLNDYLQTGSTNDSDAFIAAQADAIPQGKWVKLTLHPSRVGGRYVIGVNDENTTPGLKGNILDGCRAIGVKGLTVIDHHKDFTHCLSCEAAGTGLKQDVFKNLVLRDFDIDGHVNEVGYGFAEFNYQMNLHAVTNFLIDNVGFLNPRSDGIYLGTSNIGDQNYKRRNKNGLIRNCLFSGGKIAGLQGGNNRNGISISDISGLRVEGCRFIDFTRPGDGLSNVNPPFVPTQGIRMPGPIDFEPTNTFDVVMENVTISNCSADNIGGAFVNLLYSHCNGIRVENSSVNNARLGLCQGFGAENIPDYSNVIFDGFEVTNCGRPYEVTRFAGMHIQNGRFENCGLPGVWGYVGGQMVRNSSMENVEFLRCGTIGGAVMESRGWDNHTYRNITFHNCNTNGWVLRGGNAFKNTTIDNLRVINDSGADYSIVNAINVISNDSDGTPVFSESTISVTNLDVRGTNILGFFARGMTAGAAPQAGSFPYGFRVNASEGVESGGPDHWWNAVDSTVSRVPDFVPVGQIPRAPADPSYVSGTFSQKTNIGEAAPNTGRWQSTARNAVLFDATPRNGGSGQPGLTFYVTAPYSGDDGVFIGMSTDSSPGTNDIGRKTAGVSFKSGQLQNFVDGGAYGIPYGSFKYGDRFRVSFIYSGSSTFFKVDRIGSGGSFTNISSVNIGIKTAMYPLVTTDRAYSNFQVYYVS